MHQWVTFLVYLMTSSYVYCQNSLFIVGGRDAEVNEFPHMAVIKVSNRFVCGGVYVKEGYVLTARHCVDDVRWSEIKVVLGDYRRLEVDEDEESIGVATVTFHDYYDAALLKLTCIPVRSDAIGTILISRYVPDVGNPVIAAGWGWTTPGTTSLSNIMQKADIPVVNNAVCHASGLFAGSHEFCAGFPNNYTNVCHGDSGGPVIKELNNRFYLLGIVLRGEYRCPATARYAIFLKASYIRTWIIRNSESIMSNCAPRPSGRSSESCFPADGRVTLETGNSTAVSSLHPGDRILAMSSSGVPVYSKFISFLHMNSTQVATFLAIHTDTHTLQISQKHLLYIQDKTNTKGFYDFAKNVKVGQYVLTAALEGGFSASRVNGVESFVDAGVYAPLTAEGTVVVDGVVASCYAEVQSHNLAHMAIWPYRMWKQYVETATYTTQDMPTYVKFLQTFVLPSVVSN